jgi:hypothetical protein
MSPSPARDTLLATVDEKRFMASVVKRARFHGFACFHPFDSRRSREGWPDLTLGKLVPRDDGRPPFRVVIFAELKTEKGKLTAAQQWWLLVLGGHVWVPTDLRDGTIDAVLSGASNATKYPRMDIPRFGLPALLGRDAPRVRAPQGGRA